MRMQPTLFDLTSARQRDEIHRQLCNRYNEHLGHEVRTVPYRTHHVACLNGIHWVDLRADLEGASADFHVLIPNRYAALVLGDGFRAQRR